MIPMKGCEREYQMSDPCRKISGIFEDGKKALKALFKCIKTQSRQIAGIYSAEFRHCEIPDQLDQLINFINLLNACTNSFSIKRVDPVDLEFHNAPNSSIFSAFPLVGRPEIGRFSAIFRIFRTEHHCRFKFRYRFRRFRLERIRTRVRFRFSFRVTVFTHLKFFL
jgi:hypothetical protein